LQVFREKGNGIDGRQEEEREAKKTLVKLHERGLDSIGAVGEDVQDRASWRKRVHTGDPAQGDNP